MAENDNIHKGHRQRMLQKFRQYGIECFEEHEILEILLYSSYTRRNTNDIAHQLIKQFGSLSGVLNADFDELCQVENVGPNAAAMLRFFKEFAIHNSRIDFSGITLSSSDEVRKFCHKLLCQCTVEVAYALFLDDAFSLISNLRVSRGNTSRVEFDLKLTIKKALECHASKIILAHNHPHGVLMPSAADVATTRRTASALRDIGIELIDHIIVNEEDGYSMRSAGLLPDLWL